MDQIIYSTETISLIIIYIPQEEHPQDEVTDNSEIRRWKEERIVEKAKIRGIVDRDRE